MDNNNIKFQAKLFNFRKPKFLAEKEKKGAPITFVVSTDAQCFAIIATNAPEKKFRSGVNTFFIEASYPTPPADGIYIIEIFTNKSRGDKQYTNVRVLEGPINQANSITTPAPLSEIPKQSDKRKKLLDVESAVTDPDLDPYDSDCSSEDDLFNIDLSQNFQRVIQLLEKQERYHAKLARVSKSLAVEMKSLEQQMARASVNRI